MFQWVSNLIGKSEITNSPASQVSLADPLSHLSIVSPNPQFGVIRLVTDLNPRDPSYKEQLALVAIEVSHATGFPARAIAQLNEVQMIGIREDKFDALHDQLKRIVDGSEAELGGKLTDDQQSLLSRIVLNAAEARNVTAAGSGYTMIYLPLREESSSPVFQQDDGMRLAALIGGLLREQKEVDASAAWDASGQQVIVSLPKSSNPDAPANFLGSLRRLGGANPPLLEA